MLIARQGLTWPQVATIEMVTDLMKTWLFPEMVKSIHKPSGSVLIVMIIRQLPARQAISGMIRRANNIIRCI
jgi:hypothetical protein